MTERFDWAEAGYAILGWSVVLLGAGGLLRLGWVAMQGMGF